MLKGMLEVQVKADACEEPHALRIYGTAPARGRHLPIQLPRDAKGSFDVSLRLMSAVRGRDIDRSTLEPYVN